MTYWALLANPNYYRIEEAVRARADDWWTTKGRDLHRGDMVLIWKAKGNEENRGIVALGKVVGEPEVRSEAGNKYWIGNRGVEPEPRVPIHYVISSELPLWYSEATALLLDRLTVCRATGGTVFHVAPDEWEAVLAATGGWPDEDAGSDVQDAVATVNSLAKPLHTSQGFRVSQEQRTAIERLAMEAAKSYYVHLGWSVNDDVHLTEPYDLHCTKPGGLELRVEVKGTSSTGEAILLTPNEVQHNCAHEPNTALFVLAGVICSCGPSGELLVSGGHQTVVEPWHIKQEDLTPIGFSYQVPLPNLAPQPSKPGSQAGRTRS